MITLLIILQFGFSFAGAPSYDEEVCAKPSSRFYYKPSSFLNYVKKFIDYVVPPNYKPWSVPNQVSVAMTIKRPHRKPGPKPTEPVVTAAKPTMPPAVIDAKTTIKPVEQATTEPVSRPGSKPALNDLPGNTSGPYFNPASLPIGCKILKTGKDAANQYKEFFPLAGIANVTGTAMTFKVEVRSKSGANIFLSAKRLDPETPEAAYGWLIELSSDLIVSSYIHLVTSGNSDYSLNTKAMVFKKTPRMLRKKYFSGFWISLDSNLNISVGKKCESEPILSYKHWINGPVRYVSFSSKDDSDAEWIFGCSKDIIV